MENVVDRTVITHWIHSLESGQFEQAHERLVRWDDHAQNVAYCCLGVAGKVCLDLDDEQLADISSLYYGLLSDEQANQLGLNEYMQKVLYSLNDGNVFDLYYEGWLSDNKGWYGFINIESYTFEEIAGVLRRYFDIKD